MTTIAKPAQTQMYAIMIAGVIRSARRATSSPRTARRRCSRRSRRGADPSMPPRTRTCRRSRPWRSRHADPTRRGARRSLLEDRAPPRSTTPAVPPPGLKSLHTTPVMPPGAPPGRPRPRRRRGSRTADRREAEQRDAARLNGIGEDEACLGAALEALGRRPCRGEHAGGRDRVLHDRDRRVHVLPGRDPSRTSRRQMTPAAKSEIAIGMKTAILNAVEKRTRSVSTANTSPIAVTNAGTIRTQSELFRSAVRRLSSVKIVSVVVDPDELVARSVEEAPVDRAERPGRRSRRRGTRARVRGTPRRLRTLARVAALGPRRAEPR